MAGRNSPQSLEDVSDPKWPLANFGYSRLSGLRILSSDAHSSNCNCTRLTLDTLKLDYLDGCREEYDSELNVYAGDQTS
jgi:hypothetical protein